MLLLLYICGLVATAIARPEPPIGYNYPSPVSVGNSLGSAQIQIPALKYTPIGLGTNDFTSNTGSALTTSGNGGDFGGQSGLNGISGPSVGFQSDSNILQSGVSTVHKHVYVHVAPEEPEEIRPRKPIVVGAPQKHYKIIFIKAPSPPKPYVPIIPLQPQNEEKTLVYVLVKKPEEAPEINFPTPVPTQPVKPEVYFIKYGTKKQQVGGAIGPNIGSHISSGNILGSGTGALPTQSLQDINTSIGQSAGPSDTQSIGISSGSSFSSSIGDAGGQLSSSAGVGSSSGIFGSSAGNQLSSSAGVGSSSGIFGSSAGNQLGSSAGVSSSSGIFGSSAGVLSKYGPPGYNK